jgi:hypothetical protein
MPRSSSEFEHRPGANGAATVSRIPHIIKDQLSGVITCRISSGTSNTSTEWSLRPENIVCTFPLFAGGEGGRFDGRYEIGCMSERGRIFKARDTQSQRRRTSS